MRSDELTEPRVRPAVIIDGPLMAYKSYFALPRSITDTAGESVNAAYGFAGMTLRLVADFQPRSLIVAWDSPRPSFRDKIYKEYKQGRISLPDDLVISQVPKVKAVIELLGVKVVSVPGFEADDVIASYCEFWKKQKQSCRIVTGDHDAIQLVSDPYVKLHLSLRGVTRFIEYDQDAVVSEFGFSPSRYVDFVALKGDVSDNLPGVPGFGSKRARALVASTASFDEILESPKLQEKLKSIPDLIERLRRTFNLATLVRDVEIPESTEWELPPKTTLDMLDEMGLKALRERAEQLRFLDHGEPPHSADVKE